MPGYRGCMSNDSRATRERGKQRKSLLLEATIRVMAERGLAGVTHRAVATEAGVSASSTTYFFDSLDDMIGEAVSDALATEMERLAVFRERVQSQDYDGPAVIDEFIEYLRGNRDASTIAQFEAYLFASRRPELQPRVAEFVRMTRTLAHEVLSAAGLHDERAAEAAVAMIDGFALHHLADPHPDHFEIVARALRALLAGFATLPFTESRSEQVTTVIGHMSKQTGD